MEITFIYNPLTILFLVLNLFQLVFNHAEYPLVLLVSFDGFRWDYLQKAKAAGHSTLNFDKLIQNGVKVDKPGLQNSFATKTFPNHYTLVTGMFEENHGVVANEMFDPKTKQHFSLRNSQDVKNAFWFNNGTPAVKGQAYRGPQPIWNLNQMHGKGPSKRKSGVMFWPGSEAAVGGDHPAHCEHYNSSLPNKTRIDKVVDWFATEDKPINLGLLYFSEPDHLGHEVGPDSPRMMIMIQELDLLVGYLIQRLKEVHIFEKINIIITSDHGMANQKYIVEMDQYVDPNLYDEYGGSPVWHIYPHEGQEEKVLEGLKMAKNVHVYKKEDIPRSYHYTYNRRILPIIVEAAENYVLCHNKTKDLCRVGGGGHGYNNSLPSMHPFFIAHGPAFKKNYTSKPFKNVDIYPLMCHILEIDPPQNIDGTMTGVRDILFDDILVFEITSITFLLSVAFTALIAGICCISACRIYRIQIRKLKTRRIDVQLGRVKVNGRKPLLDSDSDIDIEAFT